ncbi:MAG: tRNA (N6-threonylcarbamoyladenosine(37)-N6)-methyltransferase TrmO [Candidatus Zixiibacteriota bacterium]|nr:MAG: tRNA (N6-threonylcarbamoyladenosine(37)-N6)-methyltransferase TrmO [candidate division Zixibacteria bacterium]
MKKFEIHAVGYVRNEVKKPRFGGWQDLISEIHLLPDLEEGLDGIKDYSHLVVLYWLDKVDKVKLKMHPQHKNGVPKVGIFACRCPSRPNPIAATSCQLIETKGSTLKVKGLDAIDGSLVIDIKPYWPQYDQVPAAKYPEWVDKLEF